jgi:hypothetical protein
VNTNLDTRLRDSLNEHTTAIGAPPVDIANLVRRGQRRRRRRSSAAVLATVAAVTAAVVLPQSLTGGTDVRTTNQQSRGGLPIAADGATGPESVDGPTGLFVTKSRVYLDGKSYAVRLPWDTGAHVGKLGVAYPAPHTNRPMLLTRDGREEALAPVHPVGADASYDDWVAADGNGPLVAWAENGKDGTDIVAFDTSTMSEVGRKTTMPCGSNGTRSGCPRPYVVSDGLVFITTGPGTEAWDPIADTSEQVSDGTIEQAHNKVLTTFDAKKVTIRRVGRGWEQAWHPANKDGGLLSYDGGWLLDTNGNPKVVNWRDRNQSITYHPPGTVEEATFDTDGSVLVVTQHSGTYTGWDCALGGECRMVVAPSDQEIRLVAWDT